MTFTWIAPAGGAFNDPANWNPRNCDFPRLADDIARFPHLTDTPYAVSANGANAGRFVVDGPTLDLNGSASVVHNSIVEPSLAIMRGGTLLLDNGARLSDVHGSVGLLGSTPPNSGQSELQVLGVGSDATFSGRLVVGEFADGALTLQDGATLACAEAIVGDIAVGQASLRGDGARWDADSLTIGAVSASGTVEVRESAELQIVNKLIVGDLSTGTLRLIDGGTAKAADVEIGKQENGNSRGDGTIELKVESGVVSPHLDVTGSLRVGLDGDGKLEISDGATVVAGELLFPSATSLSGGGTGHVIVRGTAASGAPSELTVTTPVSLDFGFLEVLDGGLATFPELMLGSLNNTDVDVRGRADPNDPESASKIATGRLSVGVAGVGTLNVESDGEVSCSELIAGSSNGTGLGRITVDRMGSIEVNGELKVNGDSDPEPVVVIDNGGTMLATALRLGNNSLPDRADIVVKNTDRISVSILFIDNVALNAQCRIGDTSPGFLNLEGKALVTILGSAHVGNSPAGAEGLVEIGVDGAVLILGDLDVGGASPGTIRLRGNPSALNVPNRPAVINAGGRLEGVGTFLGMRVVNAGGYVSPGLSAGTLTIVGDYEQGDNGTLVIEYNGLNPGEFDRLHVTGQTTLGGRLEVHFRNGFSPPDPVAFIRSQDFVEADGIVGGDYAERIYAFPDQFVDFDDDGDKDLLDVASFQNCFGRVGEPGEECARADWEDDGVLGARDIRELSARLTGP